MKIKRKYYSHFEEDKVWERVRNNGPVNDLVSFQNHARRKNLHNELEDYQFMDDPRLIKRVDDSNWNQKVNIVREEESRARRNIERYAKLGERHGESRNRNNHLIVGAGLGAATGTALDGMIPGIGTAVGAGVGALGGLMTSRLTKNRASSKGRLRGEAQAVIDGHGDRRIGEGTSSIIVKRSIDNKSLDFDRSKYDSAYLPPPDSPNSQKFYLLNSKTGDRKAIN